MSSAKVLKNLKLGICNSFEKLLEESEMEESEEKLDYTMDYLTPVMIEAVRTELNETTEIRTKALGELRLLIKKEKNLVIPMNDAFLLPYLRSRKFNVKKAFKLIQNYWNFRKDHKDIFDTSNSKMVKELILRNIIGFLPYRDKKGCTVMVFKVGMWDPEVDTYEVMFRTITALLIHSIQFPASQVCGYRMIFDVRGLSWAQMKMCTPANVLLLIHSTQYCFPARYKGFHFLSENKLFSLAWAIIYPLLTSKIKRRVTMHSTNLRPLRDYIHPSVLPVEFGGEAGSFDNSSWDKIIDENASKVLDQLNYGYKE